MKKLLTQIVALALALPSVGAGIAIPDAATPVEKTAAQELADALRRVTGTSYEVRPESAAAGADYFVGETKAANSLLTTARRRAKLIASE